MNANKTSDFGGDPDAEAARFSGPRARRADLSTGTNPLSFPSPKLPPESRTALPDVLATNVLEKAAREFWDMPDGTPVVSAPGASALLARILALMPAATVAFPGPTCNQHAAAFSAHDWRITGPGGDAAVAVQPNSPGSRLWSVAELFARLTVADDSVTDVASSTSHVNLSVRPGTLMVRRIGRFRRVLGVRPGLAIGGPSQIAKLANWLGPWPVSGPVQALGSAL